MTPAAVEIVKISLSVAVVITLIFTFHWLKTKLRDEECNEDYDDDY